MYSFFFSACKAKSFSNSHKLLFACLELKRLKELNAGFIYEEKINQHLALFFPQQVINFYAAGSEA